MGYEMQGGYGYGAPMMREGHEGYMHPIAALLGLLVLLVILLVLLRRLRKGGTGGMHWHSCCKGAISTLEERYAKGEINTAEFEERRKTLLSPSK